MRSFKKFAVTAAALAAVGATTAACGSDDTTSSSSDDANTPESTSSSMDEAGNLVGPGCSDYAEAVPDGAGSVEGMSQDPVAVAAGNNPLLTTLTAAVSGELNPKVNLVDTLNGDKFTVFAPVDDAFAELPKKTVTALSKPAGADTLTSVLTYHVVPGQMTPDEIAGQDLKTVQGGTVKVTGSGDDLQVNGANVICGGVETANATVYLIDEVMMP